MTSDKEQTFQLTRDKSYQNKRCKVPSNLSNVPQGRLKLWDFQL